MNNYSRESKIYSPQTKNYSRESKNSSHFLNKNTLNDCTELQYP